MALRGYEVVRKCFHDAFGNALDVDAIPIASTEGGVFTPDSTSMTGHDRLHTDEEHGARVVSMFQWLEQHSPLMAMCPWCISVQGFGGPFDARFNEDGWFRQENNALKARAVVGAMQQLQASRSSTNTRAIQPSKRTPASLTAVQRAVKRQLNELGIVQSAGPKSKKSTKIASKLSTQKKETTMPSNTPAHYALIIGIDCYLKNQMPDGSYYPSLNGCVNDANNMSAFLRTKVGVPLQNIIMLTSSRSPKEGQPVEPKDQWPTYENIVAGFKALGDKATAGDHIYVHYSGHGGQANTAYQALKGPTGLDETLVPSDIGNSEARYVRDVEIAHLIQSLIDKKLIVTIVFDSCHSGGATRGMSDVAVRGIGVVDQTKRPTNSDVAEIDALQQTWRNTQTRSGTRAASVDRGWMQDTTGYVLIAACRSAELANEYRANGTSVNGALTYWLLDSLKQLGTALTYRTLHQRVLARIHGQFEQQTPQLQGEVDRVVFGADKIALPTASINVLSVTGDRVTLNAGQAQGLKTGAKLALYPLADTLAEQRLALAELTKVNVVDSIATITQVIDSAAKVQPGDQAVLLNGGDIRLSRAVRLVTQPTLPKSLRQSKALADVQKAIQEVAGGWVKIAADKAAADFQVSVNAQGEFEILDPAGHPLQLRPVLLATAADAPNQLAQRLIHLTKYRNVQAIVNDDATASLVNGLLVEWVDKPQAGGRGGKTDPKPVAVGDRLTVKAGEQIHLHIKNLLPLLPAPPNGPLPNTLNVSVLDLTPSWSIDKVWPEGAASYTLNPGEEKILPLQMSLPNGYTEGVDVLKVFVTMGTATTDYDWLTLPELDQASKSPKSRSTRGARGPLEPLFAALAVDKPKTRQVRVQDTTSEPWTVVQVEVRVVA